LNRKILRSFTFAFAFLGGINVGGHRVTMDRLRDELQTCQSAAIIKVGRHFGKVKQVLSALDMITRAADGGGALTARLRRG
jgi:hypothetical protein